MECCRALLELCLQNDVLLSIPKNVAIANARLNCLYLTLYMGMLSFCIWHFVAAKQWTAQVKVGTRALLVIGEESGHNAMMLNITSHIMCPPERNVEAGNALINSWANLSSADMRQHAQASSFAP